MISKIFNTSFESAFLDCKNILTHNKCEIVSTNFAEGEINAKKNGSLFSYGHEIKILLEKIGTEHTNITITSNSVGIQIIDWGTNVENENEIMKKLLNTIV